MSMRMLAAGCDIRVLDERLARYRLRADSFSRDPAKADAFDHSLERVFAQARDLSHAPEIQQAVDQKLRRIRFDRAMRNSRRALLDGDTARARQQAAAAFRQSRAVRPAVVVLGLAVAPGLLRYVHPLRRRISRVKYLIVRS